MQSLTYAEGLEFAMAAILGVLTSFGIYHAATALGGFFARDRRRPGERASGEAPLVTFVVPAYRDAVVLARCVRSALAVRHDPDRARVLVVADEDDAGTVEAARALVRGPGERVTRNGDGDEVARRGRVTVLVERRERAGRGKPRALQNALRYVPHEGFVAIVDADHELDPSFLERALPLFDDASVGLVQARRAPRSPDACALATWDAFEQNVGGAKALATRDRLASASFYGSTGLIRAEVLHDLGWRDCLAEDTLLSYAARERGLGVRFVAARGSTEEQVTRLRDYVRQRRRWAAGHMQVLASKLARVARAPLPLTARLDAAFHLSHYVVAVLILQYWLLKATHYWIQAPPGAIAPVLVASLAVGAVVAVVEGLVRSGARARIEGGAVAALISFALLSLVVGRAFPAPRPAPLPFALEFGIFAAPLLLMGLGYLDREIRPPAASVVEHAFRWMVVAALAIPMLVVNLHASLTGVLLSFRSTRDWMKTPRAVSA